jgi:hypothetical protein
VSHEDSGYAVFISYASADKKHAAIICRSLENRGFRCWIAPRDVRAGHEYADEIIRGIEESRCTVLLLSKAANESTFVRREIERAVSKHKPLFPLRLAEVVPSKSLELFISAAQWTDVWKGPLKNHMDRLQQDLAATLELPQLARPSKLAIVRRFVSKLVTVTILLAILAGGGFAAKRLVWDTRRAEIADWFARTFSGQSANDPAAPADANAASTANSTPPPAAALAIQPTAGSQPPTAPGGIPDAPTARHTEPAGRPPVPATGLTAKAYELLESYKATALRHEPWLSESSRGEGGFLSDSWLRSYFPAVKRVRFGETADNLDRVIEIPPSPPVEDKDAIAAVSDKYGFNFVPYRIGAKQLYVQLEFYDGTRSDTKLWKPGVDRQGRFGVRVPAEPNAAGKLVPPLFAATQLVFTNGEHYEIQFVPDPPVGTVEVMYSFDEEGFFKAPFSETYAGRVYYCLGPVRDTLVRLLFKKQDGTELGPFRYRLKDAPSMIVNMLKPRFTKEDLVQKLACIRIRERFPLDPADFPNSGVYSRGEQLTHAGLGFVQQAPVIVCLPAEQSGGQRYYDWGYVREVRVGHKMGELETVAVKVSIENVVACNVSRSRAEIWKATLPADSAAVYVQCVFKDGTTSDEIRLPIVDFTFSP